MANYPIFFSEYTAVSYTLIYGGLVWWRLKRGIINDKMLLFPQGKFVVLGALDAVADILGNIGVSVLPGELTPVLSKVLIPMTMGFSYIILRKRQVTM